MTIISIIIFSAMMLFGILVPYIIMYIEEKKLNVKEFKQKGLQE